MVSQFIINATENYFNKDIDEKNAIQDFKIIFGNLYINEFIKKLFAPYTEKTFNLGKFLFVHYDDLKHSAIRAKIFEIYNSSLNNNFAFEKEIADLTDEFSEEEDLFSENKKVPKIIVIFR